MKEKRVTYYSMGEKIVGTIYLPDDYKEGTRLPCIIPCSGITGINAVYPHLLSRHLTKHGYVCLGFDYRGWAPSEGKVGYTTVEGEYEDILASVIFAQQQPEVDPDKVVLFGWGMAAPISIMVAADNHDVKAVGCGNGYYVGERMLRHVPGYPNFLETREAAKRDRVRRVLTGEGEYVKQYACIDLPTLNQGRKTVYQERTLSSIRPDIADILQRDYGGRENFPPLLSWVYYDSISRLNVEPYLPRLAPRGLFLAGSLHDMSYPYYETMETFQAAGEGRVLYTIDGTHNDWMFDDDPRFISFIENLVAFYNKVLTIG